MLAKDAMIVWTPNRDMWLGRPTTGQIVVTTIPEATALKAHPMSVGACDLSWNETDDPGRRKLLQKYFTEIIHRDGLHEKTVREALSAVEDINPDHLSADKPAPNDESWL